MVLSSRQIEILCCKRVEFRWISGQTMPDHATIARFRERHSAVFQDLFAQVLDMVRRRDGLGGHHRAGRHQADAVVQGRVPGQPVTGGGPRDQPPGALSGQDHAGVGGRATRTQRNPYRAALDKVNLRVGELSMEVELLREKARSSGAFWQRGSKK